jgi:prepilin-type N-terminal cleavage/methylation domain-containing protein
MKRIASDQTGFTIVELMIATVVAAIILLVVTVGIVHFSNDYYKGVNVSTTQTTTQNAVDAISQAIQFNATSTVGTNGSEGFFCAGTKIFLYTMGKQFNATPSSTNWGLYMLNKTSSNCTVPGVTTSGTELLGKDMRITYLTLSQNADGVWGLELQVAYGDSDLLCSTAVSGNTKGSCAQTAADYTSSDVITRDSTHDIQCRLRNGSQFCSVVDLSTAVGQRIKG